MAGRALVARHRPTRFPPVAAADLRARGPPVPFIFPATSVPAFVHLDHARSGMQPNDHESMRLIDPLPVSRTIFIASRGPWRTRACGASRPQQVLKRVGRRHW